MSPRQHHVAERADMSRPALTVAAALSGWSAPSAHTENGACSRCDGWSLRRLFRMLEGVRSCYLLEENSAISLRPDGDLESGRAGEAHACQPYVTTDAAAPLPAAGGNPDGQHPRGCHVKPTGLAGPCLSVDRRDQSPGPGSGSREPLYTQKAHPGVWEDQWGAGPGNPLNPGDRQESSSSECLWV